MGWKIWCAGSVLASFTFNSSLSECCYLPPAWNKHDDIHELLARGFHELDIGFRKEITLHKLRSACSIFLVEPCVFRTDQRREMGVGLPL